MGQNEKSKTTSRYAHAVESQKSGGDVFKEGSTPSSAETLVEDEARQRRQLNRVAQPTTVEEPIVKMKMEKATKVAKARAEAKERVVVARAVEVAAKMQVAKAAKVEKAAKAVKDGAAAVVEEGAESGPLTKAAIDGAITWGGEPR